MKIDHTGRIAAVTGAARGIGRAIAATLAEGGATVALLDLNADGARDSAAAIAAEHGVRTWSAGLDVADSRAVADVFARLAGELGPVDILVNNAGITSTRCKLVDMDAAHWDREIAVNLSGAFYCARQVLPGMVQRQWGRIVSTSSMAGALGSHGACSYAASKSGLFGLTKSIALEYARGNVTANVVLPGLIATDAAAGMPPELRERITRRIPGRRLGQPEEIASLVAFLASEQASYINGAEVMASAGADLFTF